MVLLASPTGGNAANWPFTFRQPAQTSPGMAVAQVDDAAGRLDAVEAQMRSLTGQVEELTHELQVLQDQLKRTQDDNEFRFGQLEKGTTPKYPGVKVAD